MRSVLQLSPHIRLLFPTPLLARQHPQAAALNADLEAYIRGCAAREPSDMRSIRYGWHSKTDFLDRDRASLRALKAWAEDAVREMNRFALGEEGAAFAPRIVASWANLIGDRGYHKLHAHRNNAWAGVYYIAVPDGAGEAEAGNIEFPDPRGAAMMVTPDQFGMMVSPVSIKPAAGMLLVFPAWMQHFVNPYHGPGARITIAFNAVLRKAPAGSP